MDVPYPPAERHDVPAADPQSPPAEPRPSMEWSVGLHVRQARLADVAAAAAIEREAFSDPWSVHSFRSALDRPDVHMTVAEVRLEGGASVVAGYLVAWFVADEGEIANVAVHPDWRRRGVGAALLDDVLAAGRAAGVGAMYLEVRASNTAAQALYASRGFHPVGRRRRYYANPVEDAIVLRWESAPPSPEAGV